jgi:phage gp36-like protein
MARYATLADLFNIGAPEAAFRGHSNPELNLTDSQIEAGLEAACGHVDSYLAKRFTLPLVRAGSAITRAVCFIAAHDLLSGRGFNPANQGDDSTQLDKRVALVEKWLDKVADGTVTPDADDSSQPVPDDDGSKNTPVGGYVVSPRLSDDGDSYVVGPPRPRGW